MFGESHQLQLAPNNNILSPRAVVQNHRGSKISNNEVRKLENAQCYYTSIIKGQNNSRVAVSTCYGLMNLAVNRNVKKTLEYFEKWQDKINPGDDTHPNHHDLAILLTRIDICGDDDNCGILGASVKGGICDPKHQAAVCEDSGLRLGFIMAHEIGHTLFSQEHADCLLDAPIDHGFQMPDILPGVMYGTDFQCKELLTPTATLCDV
ncbi:hypothetical protein FQR65_LT07111 [Abscondita terminalis]|nr:hypothetical protein FQR65_LT07111 [Abscondita terminalis]